MSPTHSLLVLFMSSTQLFDTKFPAIYNFGRSMHVSWKGILLILKWFLEYDSKFLAKYILGDLMNDAEGARGQVAAMRPDMTILCQSQVWLWWKRTRFSVTVLQFRLNPTHFNVISMFFFQNQKVSGFWDLHISRILGCVFLSIWWSKSCRLAQKLNSTICFWSWLRLYRAV